jgi:hypothetical protein
MKWGSGKRRAVEDQSAPIPENITSKLGRNNQMDAGHPTSAFEDQPRYP